MKYKKPSFFLFSALLYLSNACIYLVGFFPRSLSSAKKAKQHKRPVKKKKEQNNKWLHKKT